MKPNELVELILWSAAQPVTDAHGGTHRDSVLRDMVTAAIGRIKVGDLTEAQAAAIAEVRRAYRAGELGPIAGLGE